MMTRLTRVGRVGIGLVMVGTFTLSGEVRVPAARGQAPTAQMPPSGGDIDLTPFEQSAEVRQLVVTHRMEPDPGEPAGAIKAYLLTDAKLRKAIVRVRLGPLPDEPAFDPDAVLDDVLRVRQRAAVSYPTSRHAWQGLGDVLWHKYLWNARASDMRGAVDAYVKAAKLLIPRGVDNNERDFGNLARIIAGGLATLSDTASMDAFFAGLRKTDFWPLCRLPYAVALGSLNDPRADQLFREELDQVGYGLTLPDYVDYLWDRGRYQEALRVLDLKNPASQRLQQVAQRAAILERLGRLAEARAEYQRYLDTAPKGPFFKARVSDRYQIPGSVLQRGIDFYPPIDRLPKPTSGLQHPLAPVSAYTSKSS